MNLVRLTLTFLLVACSLLFGVAIADDDGPRTGFFRVSLTPTELLGEAGARGVADTLVPEEKLSWQIYVPNNYKPERPPGILVYVSRNEWGASPKEWNGVLTDKNLISIGANSGDGAVELREHMIKAIIAPLVLQRDYELNLERCYVAGYLGGGATASLVAMARPAQFRGGLYISGAASWGDTLPPKIEQVRQNRYVFIAARNDKSFNELLRVYTDFKDAGIEAVKLIRTRDFAYWEGPSSQYVRTAIEYLDGEATD